MSAPGEFLQSFLLACPLRWAGFCSQSSRSPAQAAMRCAQAPKIPSQEARPHVRGLQMSPILIIHYFLTTGG